ncbi:hypothetical protein C8Q74DRAFT_794266 [Fomes fomentarius]|nr:hypothetical protein C8Q74DRAFT_794266 [Fomes fomentarius]
MYMLKDVIIVCHPIRVLHFGYSGEHTGLLSQGFLRYMPIEYNDASSIRPYFAYRRRLGSTVPRPSPLALDSAAVTACSCAHTRCSSAKKRYRSDCSLCTFEPCSTGSHSIAEQSGLIRRERIRKTSGYGQSAQSAAAIDSTWTISPLNLRRRWGSLWRQVAGRHALLRRMHPDNTFVGVTRYIFASPSPNSLPPMQQKCTLAATTPIRLVADITATPQARQQSIFPFHGPERGEGGFRGHAQ